MVKLPHLKEENRGFSQIFRRKLEVFESRMSSFPFPDASIHHTTSLIQSAALPTKLVADDRLFATSLLFWNVSSLPYSVVTQLMDVIFCICSHLDSTPSGLPLQYPNNLWVDRCKASPYLSEVMQNKSGLASNPQSSSYEKHAAGITCPYCFRIQDRSRYLALHSSVTKL